jgi:hypothetical protein
VKDISEEIIPKTQKQRRFEAFARHKNRFKTPCGCGLVLASCHCQDYCRCELFVKTCRCEWPVEKLDEFGRWLAELDPESFADRPSPDETLSPMFVLKRSVRIGVMASRFESGYSIWHHDDRLSESLKNGACLSMSRNGEAQFGGVEGPTGGTLCPCCRMPASRHSKPFCNECATARKRSDEKKVDILRESA